MRASTLTACGLLALLVAGCGGGTTTVTASNPPAAKTAGATATTSTSTSTASAPASQPQPSAQSSETATLTACGTLRARFEGIEHRYDIRDPQPGAMHGRRVARELLAAGAEALRYDHEAEAELRRDGGSAKAIVALERAERGVARLNRGLRQTTSNGWPTGLRLQARFLRFELAQLRAVCKNAQR